MNQASDMLFIQSLAFFGKKWLFLEKNLKNDNFLNGIKSKTRQNKELKYRRKNMVWFSCSAFLLYYVVLRSSQRWRQTCTQSMKQVRVVTVFKYGKRFRFTPSSNKRSRTRAGSCYLVYITLKKSAEFYSVSWPPSNLQLAGTLQVEIVILLRVEISGLSRLTRNMVL